MKKIIVSIFAFIAIALTGNLFSQAAYLDKPEEFDPYQTLQNHGEFETHQ